MYVSLSVCACTGVSVGEIYFFKENSKLVPHSQRRSSCVNGWQVWRSLWASNPKSLQNNNKKLPRKYAMGNGEGGGGAWCLLNSVPQTLFSLSVFILLRPVSSDSKLNEQVSRLEKDLEASRSLGKERIASAEAAQEGMQKELAM